MHKILGLALASVLGAAGIAFTQPALAQNQITINNGAPCTWSSYSVTSSGNYNFSASGSCGSGTVAAPVCSAPTINTTSISVGQTATLTANCTNSPTSYTWTPAGSNSAGGPTISSTAVSTGALTFNSPGTFAYTVTATNSGGTSAASPQTSLTVIPLPTVVPTCTAVNPTPATITANNNITLAAVCDQAPTSYAWAVTAGNPAGGPTTIASTTSSTGPLTFTAAGTFNFTVTATNNVGPSAAFPVTVTVGAMAVPTCTVSANPTAIPSGGGSTTLTATCTSALSGTTYAWTPSAGAPGVTGSGAVVSASFPSGTAAGTYSYGVIAINTAGASASASTNVTMSAPAAAGCVIKDKATDYPSWTMGGSPNTVGSPLIAQPPNETWAYKFSASEMFSSGANAVSAIQLYESGSHMTTVSLTTTPCTFTNSPAPILCQRTGNSGSLGMSFVASTHSAPDSAITGAGYCRAPAISGEVYLNVKFAGPTNIVSPSTSTCPNSTCGYQPLYMRLQ